MRTFQTVTCKKNRGKRAKCKAFSKPLFSIHHAPSISEHAFTLVELIIVIFIISLTAALVIPSLQGTGESALRSEAKRIGSTFRYVNDEAVGKKQTYKFRIDLDSGTWGYEGEAESRTHRLAKGVLIKDVVIPSHGGISGGEVVIEFGPLGPGEPLTVHLAKDESEYTVTFNHLNGRAKVLKGYVQ